MEPREPKIEHEQEPKIETSKHLEVTDSELDLLLWGLDRVRGTTRSESDEETLEQLEKKLESLRGDVYK